MNEWSRDLVSVIIVSCNKRQLLSALLLSLNRQSYTRIEKIVVLNNCRKEEIEDLGRNFPEAKVIANQENLLFCRAQNQGIRVARGEFTLCLNDDLVLEQSFIEQMVRAAKRDERIGMVSGCIMRQDKQTLDTTGLFLARSRKPQERGYGKSRNGRYQEEGYIFGSGGVAPLYRRNMLEDIKIGNEYFDEDYGIFYEDLDISWRAQNRNWKGYFTPGALAYHLRGGTVKQRGPGFSFLQKYNFACLSRELKLSLIKNRYMTVIKNDSIGCFLRDLPWFLVYELKIWLYLILFEPVVGLGIFKDPGFVKLAWQKRKAISKGALKRQNVA